MANWFAFRLSGLTLNPGETRVYGAADFGVLDPSAFAEGIGLFPGFDQTTLTLTRDDSVLPRITADDDGWRGSLVLAKFAVPESGCSSLLQALGFVGVCALMAFLRPSPKTEQASLWSQTRPPRAGKCKGAAAGAWHTAALRVAQASCLWCRTGILPVSAGCKPALPDRRGTCSTNRFTERARWNSSRKADPPQPA